MKPPFKYSYLWVVVMSLILLTSACNSKKYIREIPYNYTSEQYAKTTDESISHIHSQYTNIDDNSEKLSDEQLRIKEKYSIIMEVMPKEVTDYQLYSYIDQWIGNGRYE